MNGRGKVNRWAVVLAVLVGAIVVGSIGYQLGVSHGLAINGQAGAVPPAGFVPYGYYRPWGFGFLFPLVFFGFWFLLFRGLFWGGPWPRHWHYSGPDDARRMFDDWHRRAHEQMKGETASPPSNG
jgi:hypothetical protein